MGVILWTLKTSIWAGESEARKLSHLPLGSAEGFWCFLYDHALALCFGVGALTVLVGEATPWRTRRKEKGI